MNKTQNTKITQITNKLYQSKEKRIQGNWRRGKSCHLNDRKQESLDTQD